LIGIEQAADGGWISTFSTPSGQELVHSKALLITAPAHITAAIVSPVLPAALELTDINYPAVASVTLAYPNDAFKVRLIFITGFVEIDC
jgi:predicted NAD/FAD-dependent oxidoreductase